MFKMLKKIQKYTDRIFIPLFILFYVQKFNDTYIIPQDILYWSVMALVIFSGLFWFNVDDSGKISLQKHNYLAAIIWSTGVLFIFLFWLAVVGVEFTWYGLVLTFVAGFLIKDKPIKNTLKSEECFKP